ncbi:uncharacterized protein LOC100373044, partial [Saccoglossus kowalevskii]|uniref:Titin-like n=1 Tax=Saccoglossus kowalevskii TaxID=10224 RepID=A0ABM0MXZ6_SACKO
MSFSPEMEPTDCHDYSNASGEISDAGTPGKFRPLGSFDQVGDVLAAEKQNGVDKAPEEECTSAALAVDAPESDDRPQTNGEVEEKDAEQKDVHEQVEASVATIEAEPRQQLEDKISDESHVEGAKEVGVDVGDLVNSSPDEKQKGEGKVVEEIVVDMETEPKAMAPPENGTPQQNEATAKKAKRRSFLESLHFPKFDFSPGRSKQHSMATQTPHNDKEREKEYKKAKVFKEKKPKEKKQKHKDKKTKSSEPKSPVTSEPDTEKKDLDETDEGKNNVDSKDLCKEEEPVEVAKTTDDEPVSLNNKEEDISAIEWDLEKQMRLVEEEFAKLDEVAGDFCLDDEQSNDALATTPEKDDQPTHMVTFDDKKPAEDDVPKDKSVQFQKPEGGDDEIIMAVVVEREIIQPEMAQVQIEKHDTSSTSSISSEENKETPEVTINVEDTDEDKQKPDTEPEAVIVVPSTSDVKATDSSKEKIKEDKGKKKEKKEKQKKILKSKDRNKDKKTTTETGLVVVGKDERPISVSSISTDDTKESNTSKEGTLEKGKKKKEKAVKKKTPKEEKKKKDKKEKDDKKVKAPVKEEASHSSKESGETKEDLPKPVKVQKREKKKPSKEKEKNRKSVIETGLVVVEVPSKVSDDQVVSSGRIEAPSDQENVVSEPQKCEEENVIAVVSPDKVDEQEKIDVSDPEKTAVVGPDEVDNQEKAEVREPEKTEDDSIIAVVIPDEIDDQENMEVYEPEKFEEEKIIAIVHPEGVDELEKVEISEPEKPDEENLIATVSPDEVDDQEKVDIIEPEQLEISDPEKLEISEPEKLEISEPEENVIAVVSPEEVEDLKEIGEPEKEEAAIKVVSPEIDQEIVEKEEPEKVEVLPVKVEKEKRKIKIHKKKHKEEKKKNKEEKTKPKEEEKKPKEVIETGLVVVDEGGRPLSITSINSEEITEHDTTKESPDAEKEEKHKESPKKKTKEGKKDKKDKAEKKKKRKSQQDDKEQEITIKKEIIVKAEVEVEPSEEQKKEKHKKIEAKTEKKSPDKKEEKKGKKRKDKEQATSEKTEHGKRRKAEKDTPKKKKDSSWKLKHKEKRKAEKSADAENPASPTSPTSISSFEDPDATKSDVDTTRSDDELRPLSITSFSSDTDQPTTDGETSRPVSHVTVPEGGDHLVSPDGSQPGTCSDDIEIRPLSPISISSDSSVRPASQVITDEELKKPETKQPKTHKFRTFPRSSTPKKPKRKDRYKDRRSLDAEDITSYMVEPSIPKNLPEPASKHHRVVVAIDFGTTFSGYAYSFTNDPEYIHIMRKWEGGDPGVTNMKTPTTLLMTSDGHFHSFGFSARDFYHDLDHSEAKKWLYFDKFKMTLHTSQ